MCIFPLLNSQERGESGLLNSASMSTSHKNLFLFLPPLDVSRKKGGRVRKNGIIEGKKKSAVHTVCFSYLK